MKNKNKFTNLLIFFFIIIIFFFIILILFILQYNNKKIEDFSNNINNNIIFCFWTEGNEMSENRKKCLKHMIDNTECNVVLITKDNLHEYILKDHPLHKGYPYLSAIHKSDYLRTYFMHFHGGGYSDIKMVTGSWKPAFDDIIQNNNIYINGYPELESFNLKDHIGNCSYICRPNTEFTQEWYSKLIKKMDEKINAFQKYDFYPSPNQEFNEHYPIHWEEILGDIFRTVLPNYIGKERILYSVPIPIFNHYR